MAILLVSNNQYTPFMLGSWLLAEAHHDSDLDAVLERVEAAGLIEIYTAEDGIQAMRLTADGERVARQLAMTGDDEQEVLMAALLSEA